MVRLELRRVAQPGRWINTEHEPGYRQAFGLIETAATEAQAAGTEILSRFLQTHALVGLEDVLARYPFERDWAQRQLEEWSRSGRAVVVQTSEGAMQWSAPANLEQVQRGSLAVLRREVVTCSPPQFADFLLRWQHAHPETRRGGSTGLADVLDRLQGLPLPAELWEQTVLPGARAGVSAALAGRVDGRRRWCVGLPRRRGQRGRTARILPA